MLRALLAIFRPMGTIARELTLLRELYELDLASRQPPVVRLTEQPSKADTEISYEGVRDERPGYKKWFQAAEEAEEDVQS